MGPPSCVVVLRESLTPDQFGGPWISAFGAIVREESVEGTFLEGRPANFGIANAEAEGVPRIALRNQHLANPDFTRAVQKAVDWTPRQAVRVEGCTSASYNHVMVPEVS